MEGQHPQGPLESREWYLRWGGSLSSACRLLTTLLLTVLPGLGSGESRRHEYCPEQDQPDTYGEVPEAAGYLPYSGKAGKEREIQLKDMLEFGSPLKEKGQRNRG